MSKIVIITGAGSGIGKELCSYFTQKGWILCAADLFKERAKRVAREVSSINHQVQAFGVDVRNAREVRDMFDFCYSRFGRIDALVNNAGITDKQHRTILKVPYELWCDIISTNLTGSFTCLKECAEVMSRQGGGNIVNITSLLGQRGYTREGDAAYGISKAALEALTEYAAAELATSHINVNSAYPGVMVNTGFFDYLHETERKKLASPQVMNELVYLLCELEPGELSGKSFCVQTWGEHPELTALYRKYLAGEEDEGTV